MIIFHNKQVQKQAHLLSTTGFFILLQGVSKVRNVESLHIGALTDLISISMFESLLCQSNSFCLPIKSASTLHNIYTAQKNV